MLVFHAWLFLPNSTIQLLSSIFIHPPLYPIPPSILLHLPHPSCYPSPSCALSYVTTSLRSHSSSSVLSTILYPSSSFYIILDSSIIFHSRLSTFMPLRLSQFPSTEPNTYFTTSVFKISFLSSSLSSKICSIRLFRILLFLSF